MPEIVVGTDGSAASREALLWSLEQAGRTGSAVTALYVWRVLSRDPLRLPDHRLDPGEDLQPTCHRGLPQTTASRVAAATPDSARRQGPDADLLVVGARQHTDLRGSVSSYCLNHSRTPVAVVPADASSRSSHRQHRVAVGVDLTPDSADALRWASREADSRDAELVVTHAWQVAPGSLADLAHHANTRRAQETRAVQELRNWVDDVLGTAQRSPMQLYAEHGGPLDMLLNHAAEADLLVLGSRGHHPLARLIGGSMSGRLPLGHCSCPVVHRRRLARTTRRGSALVPRRAPGRQPSTAQRHPVDGSVVDGQRHVHDRTDRSRPSWTIGSCRIAPTARIADWGGLMMGVKGFRAEDSEVGDGQLFTALELMLARVTRPGPADQVVARG